MEKKWSIIWALALLSASASAEGYLTSTCQSVLPGDLVNVIVVDDVDGNGIPNILAGTSVNGKIYNLVYKGADCSIDWSAMKSGGWVYDSSGDVRSIKVVSLLADGKKQVVMNSAKSQASGSRTPGPYLRAISQNAIDFWSFRDECGFSFAVDAADLDGTGKPNVVFGTMGKYVCALKDSRDGLLEKNAVMWKYIAKSPVHYVKTLDIDGDGKVETVALDKEYLSSNIYALDNAGKLKWQVAIEGGVHKPVLPANIMDVRDINGDGKAETVVGTYKNGVRAYDSKGADLWSYDTGKLVTALLVDDLDGDGSYETLAGAAPRIVALDSGGTPLWTWTMEAKNGTINAMAAYDVDGDGRKEVVVGATKYLYVIDDDGSLKGSWQYITEIQGGKAYKERDANAVAVAAGDFDADGEAEVAAAWNWEDGTIRGNQYSTTIRVYEINKQYVPTTSLKATATTAPADEAVDNDQNQAGEDTEATVDEEDYDADETENIVDTPDPRPGPCAFIPMLPALLALGAAIALKVPFAARR